MKPNDVLSNLDLEGVAAGSMKRGGLFGLLGGAVGNQPFRPVVTPPPQKKE